MSEIATTEWDGPLEMLNDWKGLTAHTDGGGMKNDITVEMDRLSRLSTEHIDQIQEMGYRVSSVGTGGDPDLGFHGVVTFEKVEE